MPNKLPNHVVKGRSAFYLHLHGILNEGKVLPNARHKDPHASSSFVTPEYSFVIKFGITKLTYDSLTPQ